MLSRDCLVYRYKKNKKEKEKKNRPCIKLAVLTACISKSLCATFAMRGSSVVKHFLLLIMTDMHCFASQKRKGRGSSRSFHAHIFSSCSNNWLMLYGKGKRNSARSYK